MQKNCWFKNCQFFNCYRYNFRGPHLVRSWFSETKVELFSFVCCQGLLVLFCFVLFFVFCFLFLFCLFVCCFLRQGRFQLHTIDLRKQFLVLCCKSITEFSKFSYLKVSCWCNFYFKQRRNRGWCGSRSWEGMGSTSNIILTTSSLPPYNAHLILYL